MFLNMEHWLTVKSYKSEVAWESFSLSFSLGPKGPEIFHRRLDTEA